MGLFVFSSCLNLNSNGLRVVGHKGLNCHEFDNVMEKQWKGNDMEITENKRAVVSLNCFQQVV